VGKRERKKRGNEKLKSVDYYVQQACFHCSIATSGRKFPQGVISSEC
jgi:hypothetical protein